MKQGRFTPKDELGYVSPYRQRLKDASAKEATAVKKSVTESRSRGYFAGAARAGPSERKLVDLERGIKSLKRKK